MLYPMNYVRIRMVSVSEDLRFPQTALCEVQPFSWQAWAFVPNPWVNQCKKNHHYFTIWDLYQFTFIIVFVANPQLQLSIVNSYSVRCSEPRIPQMKSFSSTIRVPTRLMLEMRSPTNPQIQRTRKTPVMTCALVCPYILD